MDRQLHHACDRVVRGPQQLSGARPGTRLSRWAPSRETSRPQKSGPANSVRDCVNFTSVCTRRRESVVSSIRSRYQKGGGIAHSPILASAIERLEAPVLQRPSASHRWISFMDFLDQVHHWFPTELPRDFGAEVEVYA